MSIFCSVYVGLLRRTADRAFRFRDEGAAAFGKVMSILPTFCLLDHSGCSMVFLTMQHPTSSRESFAGHHHHSARHHPTLPRESLTAHHQHSAMQRPSSLRESPTGNDRWRGWLYIELLCILRSRFVLVAPFLQLPAPSYHPSRRGHEDRTRTCSPATSFSIGHTILRDALWNYGF
jgi:hypothetical protein